tara:strand:+ start:78 stop:218 length:141 start_codon:yes stop_codon:yes gene_type:complete
MSLIAFQKFDVVLSIEKYSEPPIALALILYKLEVPSLKFRKSFDKI